MDKKVKKLSSANSGNNLGSEKTRKQHIQESVVSNRSSGLSSRKGSDGTKENFGTVDSNKRKKKATKFVASRYMESQRQLDLKHSAKSNATVAKKTDGVLSPDNLIKVKHKSPQRPSIPTPVLEAQTSNDNKITHKTKKASTPNSGFKTFFESDMSHIQPITAAKVQEVLKTPHYAQRDLDIAYSNYIRQSYIKFAMQQAAETKHQTALIDLTKLCNTNVSLQNEIAELEEEVAFLEYNERLHQLLDAQISALEPVVGKLSSIERKYKELVENIDTTRHSLPVEDAALCEENFELLLQETQNILSNIMSSTNISLPEENCDSMESALKLAQLICQEKESAYCADEIVETLAALSCKERHLKLQLDTEKTLS